jgi:TetR/AcrR family transcriptional repressor of nem operon
VIQEAAREIRVQGPDRVGVADIMAKAGLTHGGFYAHFASKDDLVQAAVAKMFEDSRARIGREMDGRSPAEGLSAYIDFYLSALHRDARGAGCAMAALNSDLPRLPQATRTLFAERMAILTERLFVALDALGRPDARDEASSTLAELVGALTLARAEPDAARSDAILDRSKRMLKRRLGLETRP